MNAVALVGPTACGKSQLALSVAERINGEIISVDSGAVYCGMDIGTAKPTAAMRARVPHHLLDVAAPDAPYNVGKFHAAATAAAADITARGNIPLFVGGSMMYFNALLRGLSAAPPLPEAIGEAVRKQLETDGAAAVHAALKRVDATTAARIGVNDKQRLHRAYGVYLATGKPPTFWRQKKSPPLSLRLLALAPVNRALLRQRIHQRLQHMWADGLKEETRALLNTWQLPPTAPPLRMAGYRQATAHLLGNTDAEEMQTRAYYATCQLAKRQLTWLNQWQCRRIDPLANDAFEQIMAIIEKHAPTTH